MRKLMLALGAISLAAPAAMIVPVATAQAKSYEFKVDQQRRYRNDRRDNNDRRSYREWRGRDGRTYCRKPDGTTGLIVGGVAGALVGRSIDTRGDRSAGTLLGAVGGALAGREIDRNSGNNRRRCR